jgi:hypothetical protein
MATRKKGTRVQDITSAEKARRVNSVLTLVLQGASRDVIIQYCAKEFKTNIRASDEYLAKAKQLLIENFAKTKEKELMQAEIFARFENLYQQNIEIDDLRECRNILKDISDLLGLNAATKMDHTTKGEQIKTLQVEIVNGNKDK